MLRGTIALLGRPPLAVSYTTLGDFILKIGRAAVTTHYANCTQCAPGYYQGIDSQQVDECVSCPTGYYAAGVYALQFACAAAVVVVASMPKRRQLCERVVMPS